MSESVRPHRRQPTRLCRPWDSPGKNTGVGCHFLLQYMKVKSKSEVAQSCPTLLVTPWTAAYQAPPSLEFSPKEYWSGLPLPSPPYSTVTVNFSFLARYRSLISLSVPFPLFLLYDCHMYLGWPKSSFRFPTNLSGQPNVTTTYSDHLTMQC